MSKRVTPMEFCFALWKARQREAERRSSGLPPMPIGLRCLVRTDSGVVAPGLRGEVVCEVEEGVFEVFVGEAEVIAWLAKKGVKMAGEMAANS